MKGLGWRKLLDCISYSPKNERLKNYIDFLSHKKLEKVKDQLKQRRKSIKDPDLSTFDMQKLLQALNGSKDQIRPGQINDKKLLFNSSVEGPPQAKKKTRWQLKL